jgi:TPR repeat protein
MQQLFIKVCREMAMAEKGDAVAQYNLGVCYHHGDGVEKNYIIAAEWYHKALANGHSRAKYRLTELETGHRSIHDPDVGVRWVDTNIDS